MATGDKFKDLEFSRYDIESVAKGRVARVCDGTAKKFVWLLFACVVGGLALALATSYVYIGYGVMAIGVLVYLWRNSVVSKKQNGMKIYLVNLWRKKLEEDKKATEVK